MLITVIALLTAVPETATFPEQVPGLIESCLADAVEAGDVTDTDDSHKYICGGDTAARLWAFLELAKIASYEQDTPEGRWVSRDFPLGGCFKRIKMPGGQPMENALSCTIWVPRPVSSAANAKP